MTPIKMYFEALKPLIHRRPDGYPQDALDAAGAAAPAAFEPLAREYLRGIVLSPGRLVLHREWLALYYGVTPSRPPAASAADVFDRAWENGLTALGAADLLRLSFDVPTLAKLQADHEVSPYWVAEGMKSMELDAGPHTPPADFGSSEAPRTGGAVDTSSAEPRRAGETSGRPSLTHPSTAGRPERRSNPWVWRGAAAAVVAAGVLAIFRPWSAAVPWNEDRVGLQPTGAFAGAGPERPPLEYQVRYTPHANGFALLVHYTAAGGTGVTPNRYPNPDDTQPVRAGEAVLLKGLFVTDPDRPKPFLVVVTDRPAADVLAAEVAAAGGPAGRLSLEAADLPATLDAVRRCLARHGVRVLEHAFRPAGAGS